MRSQERAAMTDPFDDLRRPVGHTDPSPAFRARLLTAMAELAASPDRSTIGDGTDGVLDEPMEQVIVTQTQVLERRTRGRRARWLLVGGAVAAALALVVALLAARGDGSDVTVVNTPDASSTTTGQPQPPTSAAGGAALPAIEPLPGTDVYATAQYGTAVTVDGQTVWVSHDSGPIDRYDARTGALLGQVAVTNASLAARPVLGFGSLWVTTDLDDTLWRVDTSTGAVITSIKIPGDIRGNDYLGQHTAAISEDAVWVVTFDPNGSSKLFRVDPTNNSVSGSIPAPPAATNVIYAEGSLWVLQAEGPLVRIDPASGQQLASWPMWQFNAVMRFGFGSIWVLDADKDTDIIVRIDPATNTVVARIPTQPGPGYYWRDDFAFGGGFVWTSSPDATLMKIDPETNRVVGRYGPHSGGAGLGATDGALWFSVWSGTELHRLRLG
jgi:outer membrane protein assembly factor BamB